MNAKWKEIQPDDLAESVFKNIGTEWMLVTAGTEENWNTMTASWGGMGVLWSTPVCFAFVRKSRHTYKFMNDSSHFTLSFYAEKYRDALNYCGKYSGRDVDKAAETGLTPTAVGDTVCFEEARLVFVCKKIYFHDIDPANFLDPSIESNYPNKDYHRTYIGQVERCLSL